VFLFLLLCFNHNGFSHSCRKIFRLGVDQPDLCLNFGSRGISVHLHAASQIGSGLLTFQGQIWVRIKHRTLVAKVGKKPKCCPKLGTGHVSSAVPIGNGQRYHPPTQRKLHAARASSTFPISIRTFSSSYRRKNKLFV